MGQRAYGYLIKVKLKYLKGDSNIVRLLIMGTVYCKNSCLIST